ncbi:hypothetical protein GCM10009107_33120 [Ideonella azotifigens]|uniref:Uncharacterized protein n=1 Tax=Ideonella azotifigens TaxID=513160 RepID=A0ABN1K5P2_9BURK
MALGGVAAWIAMLVPDMERLDAGRAAGRAGRAAPAMASLLGAMLVEMTSHASPGGSATQKRCMVKQRAVTYARCRQTEKSPELCSSGLNPPMEEVEETTGALIDRSINAMNRV